MLHTAGFADAGCSDALPVVGRSAVHQLPEYVMMHGTLALLMLQMDCACATVHAHAVGQYAYSRSCRHTGMPQGSARA